ncbi:MAG: hypothetical protein PHT02_08230, partial [Tissierellia bacterium]|nr:hypothetical protein [Tissierellia bacterium]
MFRKFVLKIFLILIVSTLLQPLFPLMAESITITVPIDIKTANGKNSGSDGDLFAYLIDRNGMETKTEIDTPKYDDFERNDYKTYYPSFQNAPWMLDKVRFEFDDDNGWELSHIYVNVPKLSGGIWRWFYFKGDWMGSDPGNREEITWSIGPNTKRNITYCALDDVRGNILFSESDADKYFGPKEITFKEWGSFYKWGLQITDQYDTYYPNADLYKNADKPGKVILNTDTIYKNSKDYKFELNSEESPTNITFQPYPQIWDTMKENGKDIATFNFKWIFPKASTNNNEVNSTITLKRKVFYLNQADISIPSNVSQEISEDNYFFNLDKQIIKIDAKVSNNIGVSNDDIAKQFKGKAFLLKGNYDSYERDKNNNILYSPEDKICELRYYSSINGVITFEGIIPANYTTDKKGLSFVVEDVSSLDGFVVEEKQQDDSREAGSVHKYFSSYNVDTIPPTLIIDKDVSESWARTHSFNITSREDMIDGLANYRLYNEYNQPVNITNYLGTGGVNSVQKVPITTSVIEGAEVNLKLSDKIEGKFTLKIDGRDGANNYGSKTIDNIWIDNKAPTVNVNIKYNERGADNSKRADFTFDINDLSGTGKVYYCFVDNYKIPAKNSDAWYFVQQGGDNTTASIKVEEGKDFVGRLYYYTADECGNDSYDNVNNSYKYVSLFNKNVVGYMVIKDMTSGKSRYDISFEDDDSGDRLEYRWVDKNVPKTGFVQDYIYYMQDNYGKYPDIGAAIQKGIDDKEYILDGTYELECIINSISDIKVKQSYTFVFDNSNPTIELPEWTNGTKIRDIQQAAIKISDVGSIEKATYQIVDLDNNPIGEEISLPINNGKVDTLVNIQVPEEFPSGIYGIRIYAQDAEGNSTTVGYNYLEGTEGKLNKRDASYYNNTAMRFAIRKEKPLLELFSTSGYPLVNPTSNVKPNLQLFSQESYKYITGQSTYTITLRYREIMKDIDRFKYSTYLKYQVSLDGINWSNWKATGRMTNEFGSSVIDFTINTPYELNNTAFKDIYIRAACYNDSSELGITPDEKYISEPIVISFKLDNSLADYDIAYDIIERTNKDVTGILTIHRDSNKTYTITCDNPHIDIISRDENSAAIVISKSVNTEILIEDNFGNITEVPIEVDWIDKEAPVAVINYIKEIDSGARKDAEISVTIKDTLPNTTRFALMNHEGLPIEEDYNLFDKLRVERKIKISTISSEKNYGEFDETYNITIRGIDGDYCLGYYSEDTIGNSISA